MQKEALVVSRGASAAWRLASDEGAYLNGDDEAPIYKYLKDEAPGLLGSKAIKWNFTKFLVDRSGKVVKRYAPQTKPEDLKQDIEKLL